MRKRWAEWLPPEPQPILDDSDYFDMSELGALVPRLEPYFGNLPHIPYGRCPCGGKGFRKGSVFCCMGPKCHKSGKDHLSYFRSVNRPPVLEALPPDDLEGKATPTKYVPNEKPNPQTRKEKRAAKYADRHDDSRRAG